MQYATLKEKISAEKAIRAQRYTEFAQLYQDACEAGRAAAARVTPAPMIVREDIPGGRSWTVADGPCGFAWITVTPGNCSFALWLKKQGIARRNYGEPGVIIWVSEYDQSMIRKSAYANAFAEVIRAAGIKAYAGSRLD